MRKRADAAAAKVWIFTGNETYPAGTEVHVLGKRRNLRIVRSVAGGEEFTVRAGELAERDPEPEEPEA